MQNNHLCFKRTTLLSFLFFFILVFQDTNALMPSLSTNLLEKKDTKKDNLQNNLEVEGSTNKELNQSKAVEELVFASKNTTFKKKRKKISLRKKLSILKLVLKSKYHNKKKFHTSQNKKGAKWNGRHTAGFISWISVLVAVMAFFTGHFLFGILAACSAILFLFLIFIEKDNQGTVDDTLWIFAQLINLIVIIGSIFD